MNRSDLIRVQAALDAAGFWPGDHDGIMGPKTRTAIRGLQEARGFPVTGALDRKTLAALIPNDTAASDAIRQGRAGYLVDEIMLHTSATSSAWWKGKTPEQMMDEIRVWHTRDRGWRREGYHGLIAPDGLFVPGRPYTEIGAGARGHNRGVIHICMVPIKTIERMGTFEDFYTQRQKSAVMGLILSLRDDTPVTQITGHNQVAAKLCPGFRVERTGWLQDMVA